MKEKKNSTLEIIKKRCSEGYLWGNGYIWYEFIDNSFWENTESSRHQIVDTDIRYLWFNKYRDEYIKSQIINEEVNNPWGEAYRYIINNVDSVLRNNIYQYSIFDYI